MKSINSLTICASLILLASSCSKNEPTPNNTQSNTGTDISEVTQTSQETLTHTFSDTDTLTQTQSDNDTDSQTQSDTQSETQTPTSTETETQTEPETDTNSETQTDIITLPVVESIRLEAEDYVDFFDADAGNIGNAYRDDAVDIQETIDVDNASGYSVGWTNNGEWLEYNIELAQGNYEVIARIATAVGDSTFTVSLDNQTIGFATTASTGGWANWEDLKVGEIEVEQGNYSVRIDFTSAQTNINWLQFNYLAPPVDTDQDGVSDELDLCPNTPLNADIDEDGCRLVTPVAEVAIANDILVGGLGSLFPGHTLYVYESDIDQNTSLCNDDCATVWPPVLVDDRLASGVLGLQMIERDDGTFQATYLNQPLYFYSNDQSPSDINGHNGLWSIVDVSNLSSLSTLFNEQTILEAPIQFETDTALVTRFSDRGRDRHAKENQFQAYDHFLTFYWENRTASIEIIDEVAKGGTSIRMNVRAQGRLDDLQAENRWWYIGENTLAEYCGNGAMTEVPELHDVENEIYYYYKESSVNCRENFRNIQVGDLLEFEISQFLDDAVLARGRDNYYGTTYVYVVGEGLVPWETTQTGPFIAGTKYQRDSVVIPEKAWLGGDTTIHAQESAEYDGHYMQMATNLGYENGQPFVLGRRVHHTSFVDGSHNESDENGIWEEHIGKSGNNYINDRCTNCHVRNGSAAPAQIGESLDRWVFKVGDQNGDPDPSVGRVLQPRTTNATSEGDVVITGWEESNGLRKPIFEFSNFEPVQFSARISPRLVGLGLLEAVDESTILSYADEDDLNGDGISGKVSIQTNPETGALNIGRFGWKAGTVSVKHQVAGAFNTDMGVTSSLLPNHDCGSQQTNCGQSGAEISDEDLINITKYISLLGIRPQRDYDDPEVLAGEALFTQIGCADCHVTTMQTSSLHPFGELRNQTIHPYTDLLLHDMGEGLADNLAEGSATGAEWRTTPLWGLGTSACVTGGVIGETGEVASGVDGGEVCNPVHAYLHDGRARSIEEAILWHGGESQQSNDNYQELTQQEQQNLLRFLNSL